MTNQELEIWLSIPEVAELLDVRLRDVRALMRAMNCLLCAAESRTHSLFTVTNWLSRRPVASACVLRGTITALKDAGFERRLMRCPGSGHQRRVLDEIPLQALHAGRVHAVRRACQMLAL